MNLERIFFDDFLMDEQIDNKIWVIRDDCFNKTEENYRQIGIFVESRYYQENQFIFFFLKYKYPGGDWKFVDFPDEIKNKVLTMDFVEMDQYLSSSVFKIGTFVEQVKIDKFYYYLIKYIDDFIKQNNMKKNKIKEKLRMISYLFSEEENND